MQGYQIREVTTRDGYALRLGEGVPTFYYPGQGPNEITEIEMRAESNLIRCHVANGDVVLVPMSNVQSIFAVRGPQ